MEIYKQIIHIFTGVDENRTAFVLCTNVHIILAEIYTSNINISPHSVSISLSLACVGFCLPVCLVKAFGESLAHAQNVTTIWPVIMCRGWSGGRCICLRRAGVACRMRVGGGARDDGWSRQHINLPSRAAATAPQHSQNICHCRTRAATFKSLASAHFTTSGGNECGGEGGCDSHTRTMAESISTKNLNKSKAC